MKPVIGITPTPSVETLSHGTFARHVMGVAYVDAVLEAGGVPLVLPPQPDNIGALLEVVDGVLLSGGADVEPWRYGDDRLHPATYGLDPTRDDFELALGRAAIERDLPLLGICRGIQVLNVLHGGTLIQDVPTEYESPTPVQHRQQEVGVPADEVGHRVFVADPRLRELFAAEDVGVNSFHHQGIDRLAPGLEAAARSADGLVEAVVLPARRFVVGVQWHPELMFRRHEAQRRPFAALVEAATASRLAGATT
jgi:gamma-glutamyl-gamma-aminobutyrate hydrolase PuuD